MCIRDSSGRDYVATGNLPSTAPDDTNCVVSGCNMAQTVFFDGVPLRRVLSRRELVSGTFYEDFSANQIWLYDNPSEHLVEQASASSIIRSTYTGITVSGFLIEKSAVQAQYGGIDAEYNGRKGWVIQNNEIRYHHGAGVSVLTRSSAGGSILRGNFIHDNGQEGIDGCGSDHVVEHNEISHNNTLGYDPFWEADGVKFGCGTGYEVEDLTFSGNYVHDNAGNGLWLDINSYNITITRNRISNNGFTCSANSVPGSSCANNGGDQVGDGIVLEISDRCMISNNTLTNNGFTATAPNTSSGFYVSAAILLAETPNCEVYGNRVRGVQGIGMLQQYRNDQCTFNGRNYFPDGTPVCPYDSSNKVSTHQVHDTFIHDNAMTETAQPNNPEIAGLDSDMTNDDVYFTSRHNRYVHNTYHLPVLTGAYFTWLNVLNSCQQWMADGEDTTGSCVSP